MDKKKVKETFGIEIPHWRESLAMLVEEYETNGL
jgi:dTDP-4-dehydrorhamnose reductase